MSSDSLPTGLHGRRSPTPAPVHEQRDMPAAGRIIVRLLEALQGGALRLRTPDGRIVLYGDGSHPVTLDLHNWRLCAAVLRSGDIGFAETFIAGDWRTDNLPGLIELMIRNRAQIESLIYGNWWGNLIYKMRHLLHRNSRAGSKKNIHAHYDIGNAFYQLWLDPSMTYSSALFTEGASLEQAQAAKYRRIADQLQLQPQLSQRVLEIGCGWGGFAETAARDYGAHVTGLTLSTEQLAYARQRLQDAGLAAQADLQLCDYRDSHGQYDAIASIEMFEAVGQSYWPGYFACVARNLKPGGRACIQTIVIADALFERYSKSTDFIQQYIFPGGMLPSPTEFRRAAEARGLRVVDAFSFGLDYAQTLRLWRASFLAQRTALEKQAFDGRFLLTWEFYLAYCEAAFQAHNTDVMQFTLVKE
ncbi:cyclopropane-fatty-acyl-phospholipid synthase [Janthinobacterium sp. CAN_S1]|uniref:class I SAM-dependent methyltransferase n=1 Tax=Janthinobacterium sp. CAN_S1 TaxID=2787725 RepID=UPI001A2CDEF8